MKKNDPTSNEFGELGIALISFEECMARIKFPGTIYTFKRRVEDVITEFDGPHPPVPNHFTLAQLTEFVRNLTELSRIQRLERKQKAVKVSQSETDGASNV